MDYKKLNEIAEKLESKYIPESAKGSEEAKEILAIVYYYRVYNEEKSFLKLLSFMRRKMYISTPIPNISIIKEYLKATK